MVERPVPVRALLAARVAALVFPLLLAGCELLGPVPTPAPPPAPPVPPPEAIVVSPPVEAGVDMTIYLPRLLADGSLGLSGVRRRLPATSELARAALRALIDGPNGPERAADYQYPLHPRTRVVSFRVERGIASTELDDAVSPVRGRPFSELVYWSIVYTLTEVPDVQRVTLLRQSQPLREFGYPPISIGEAAGRADAPRWAQPR